MIYLVAEPEAKEHFGSALRSLPAIVSMVLISNLLIKRKVSIEVKVIKVVE